MGYMPVAQRRQMALGPVFLEGADTGTTAVAVASTEQ